MDERAWLTERFEAERTRLRAVAYRMLGSLNEADDALQEAWLRLSRVDTGGIEVGRGKFLSVLLGGPDQRLLRGHRGEESIHRGEQERDRAVQAIRGQVALAVAPEALDGGEVRAVRRQEVPLEAGMRPQP